MWKCLRFSYFSKFIRNSSAFCGLKHKTFFLFMPLDLLWGRQNTKDDRDISPDLANIKRWHWLCQHLIHNEPAASVTVVSLVLYFSCFLVMKIMLGDVRKPCGPTAATLLLINSFAQKKISLVLVLHNYTGETMIGNSKHISGWNLVTFFLHIVHRRVSPSKND